MVDPVTDDIIQTKLKVVYGGYTMDPRFVHLRHLPGRNFVPGRGSMRPSIVFIGEAPGHHENEQRKPFVGPSGRLFDDLLRSVGINREDVFTTNVVKYRPPRNRAPWPSEIENSRPYVIDEIKVLRPRMVVTLGAVALRCVTGTRIPLGAVHGTEVPCEALSVPLVALYHPSCGVRDEAMKAVLFQDVKVVA